MICSLHVTKRRHMQSKLDKLGVTALVINIISSTETTTAGGGGESTIILDRCIELGIALLDGMNAKVRLESILLSLFLYACVCVCVCRPILLHLCKWWINTSNKHSYGVMHSLRKRSLTDDNHQSYLCFSCDGRSKSISTVTGLKRDRANFLSTSEHVWSRSVSTIR
jgi:hypothetical protein